MNIAISPLTVAAYDAVLEGHRIDNHAPADALKPTLLLQADSDRPPSRRESPYPATGTMTMLSRRKLAWGIVACVGVLLIVLETPRAQRRPPHRRLGQASSRPPDLLMPAIIQPHHPWRPIYPVFDWTTGRCKRRPAQSGRILVG